MRLRLTGWDPARTQFQRYRGALKRLSEEALMMDKLEATYNYLFASMVQGGPMSNAEKAMKFWREKVIPKEAEIKEELLTCKKQGRRTQRYDTLCKDMVKLKKEYEELSGGASYDPMNLAHVESAAERTTRQFLGYGDKR